MYVRDATPADVLAIGEIYAHEAEHGISTFDVAAAPASYWQDKIDAGPLLVAETDGRVTGFGYASAYRPRPAYALSREVSVYLSVGERGRGVGTALYTVLLERLRESGAHTALAVIALPNPASVALHESFGFSRIGVLEQVGHKFDRWIDTAWYQLLL